MVNAPRDPSQRFEPWPRSPMWGIALLWGINLALRLWNLNEPTALVFDEVHYVPFAVDYLQQQSFFDVHPPLGKYLIALSIRLGQMLGSAPDDALVKVAGIGLSPYGYRWLNALLGSLMPIAALWVAWTWAQGIPIQRRRYFALLAGLLTSWDGFSLAESRLGLLHPSMVLLGLVALGAWGRSRHARSPWRWRLLTGIALGSAIAVKWNGTGYLLALVLREWFLTPNAPLIKGGGDSRGDQTLDFSKDHVSSKQAFPWLWLGWVPLGVYSLLWIPHLRLVGEGFWAIHHTILTAHLGLTTTHSYQSSWFTWPLMIRPIAYFYQALGPGEPLSLIGPPTPHPDHAMALYGMGNPILWWLSTAAVVVGAAQMLTGGWPRRRSPLKIVTAWRQGQRLAPLPRTTATADTVQQFLIMAYLVNWLPWAMVQRSTFLYHYQPAALIAELFLAWQMSGWLTARRRSWRFWGWGLLALVFVSFWFWLPLWIGWPLPWQAMGWRWWLPSWI